MEEPSTPQEPSSAQADDERYLECWRRYRRVRRDAWISAAYVPVAGIVDSLLSSWIKLPVSLGVIAMLVLAFRLHRVMSLACARCGNDFFRYRQPMAKCRSCRLPLWGNSTGHVFEEFATKFRE